MNKTLIKIDSTVLDMVLLWYLPMFLFLGIIISFEDIRTNKIRNKWLILALIYYFTVSVLLLLFHSNAVGLTALLSGMFALLIGICLWIVGVWSAADGKLFSVLSLFAAAILPNAIALVDVLINIFVPIMVLSVLKPGKSYHSLWWYVKPGLLPKPLLESFLFVFAISWIIGALVGVLALQDVVLVTLLCILLIVKFCQRWLAKGGILLLLCLSIGRIFFDDTLTNPETWQFIIWMMIILIVIRSAVLLWAFDAFSKKVALKNLQPGMVLAQTIFEKDGKYRKRKQLTGDFEPNIQPGEKLILGPTKQGLTQKEIDQIQKISESKKTFTTVNVQEIIPFAPSIFLGVLLYAIIQNNIVSFIINLF